jgi:Gram-negative bacterial TonB protein C-terminal
LNAGGEVVSEGLVKGVGNVLDRIVLEAVKTWRFQPATVEGKPVESEDELIVPFSSRYPVSGFWPVFPWLNAKSPIGLFR